MGVLDDLVFEDVDREHYKFVEPGQKLIAKLDKVFETQGRYGKTTAIDVTEIHNSSDGRSLEYGHKWRIYATAILLRKIQTIPLEHIVMIVYQGDDETGKKHWLVSNAGHIMDIVSTIDSPNQP